MMDSGRDPRKGLFSTFRLIVSWLLAVAHSHNLYMYVHHPWPVGSFTLYTTSHVLRHVNERGRSKPQPAFQIMPPMPNLETRTLC